MIWFLYVPFDVLVTLLAYPIALILPLFADGTGDVTLSHKNPLRLWLTPDNPIEGDKNHCARWAGRSLYLQRAAWLIRNKAYGWEWFVFNAEVEDVNYRGNPLVGDNPYVKGWCFAWTKGAWMLYAVLPTFKNKCLRVYLGWKLRPFCLQKMTGGVKKGSAQIAFAVNPFKSRR